MIPSAPPTLRCLLAATLLGLAAVVPASAQTSTAPAVDPAATALWQEHIEGMGSRGTGERPIVNAQVIDKALEFFASYPEERRVSGILFNLSSFGSWIGGPDAPRLRREWRTHLQQRLVETLATDTWPDLVWSGLHWVAAKNEVALRVEDGQPPDLEAFRAHLDTVARRVPSGPYRTALEQDYVNLLEEHRPDALIPYLTELSRSDVAEIADLGRGRLAIQELKARPMDLRFTAIDGRQVDLAELRGRVVLIDCWATWCVPCIKELPNIKAALAKWGDKGFTVVGISFDRPKDREKLLKFIEAEKLEWPHWFNESGGPNPFGRRYNIRSIPATFLLDRDGLLVTTETHGEKLEAALQQLLGGR